MWIMCIHTYYDVKLDFETFIEVNIKYLQPVFKICLEEPKTHVPIGVELQGAWI